MDKPVAQSAQTAPKSTPQRKSNGFAPLIKGIPVERGQTFASLSQAQRDAYFRDHENNWKKRYNQNRTTIASQSFTRG